MRDSSIGGQGLQALENYGSEELEVALRLANAAAGAGLVEAAATYLHVAAEEVVSAVSGMVFEMHAGADFVAVAGNVAAADEAGPVVVVDAAADVAVVEDVVVETHGAEVAELVVETAIAAAIDAIGVVVGGVAVQVAAPVVVPVVDLVVHVVVVLVAVLAVVLAVAVADGVAVVVNVVVVLVSFVRDYLDCDDSLPALLLKDFDVLHYSQCEDCCYYCYCE